MYLSASLWKGHKGLVRFRSLSADLFIELINNLVDFPVLNLVTLAWNIFIRTFLGPPYVREVASVRGVEGSFLRVQCPASGYPIQAITWTKGWFPTEHKEIVFIFEKEALFEYVHNSKCVFLLNKEETYVA